MIIGCNRQPYNIFNGEFRHVAYTGKVKSLTGEVVDIDAVGGRLTWIADTLFLVYKPYDEEGFVSVFNLNSYKLLSKNLIIKGRGPNEYLDAWLVHVETDGTRVKAWFSVNYRDRLICIDVTASIGQQKLVVEREIELNIEDKFAIFRAFFDTDTSIVLQSLFNNDQISLYNPVSSEKRILGWLYLQEYDRQNINDLGAGYVYNARKSVLVGGMVFFDQINYYPLRDGKPFSVSSTRKAIKYDDVKKMLVNDRPIYYGIGCYDEDMLIWTYSSGKNRYEQFSLDQNFLHIFNWEGELQKIYELDRCLVGHSYDKKTGYLYGVDIETDKILKYKLDL
jgi:hypothetical protein